MNKSNNNNNNNNVHKSLIGHKDLNNWIIAPEIDLLKPTTWIIAHKLAQQGVSLDKTYHASFNKLKVLIKARMDNEVPVVVTRVRTALWESYTLNKFSHNLFSMSMIMHPLYIATYPK
jgi:hypothetical protein